MEDELKKLIEAFKAKEENEKFLKNLEQLKADGSIDQDIYPSMRSEYTQRLDQSAAEVEAVKDGLKKQLETIQRDQESNKYELKKVEARYRAGELQLTEYEKSTRAIRTKIDTLEQQAEELRGLIIAESASELAAAAAKPAAVTQQPPVMKPEEPKPAKTKTTKPKPSLMRLPSRNKLMFIGGAAVLLIVIIVVVVLLVPGESAVREVQIPVNITGASNIGSLHFELVYDEAMLDVTTVESGTLIGSSLYEYNIDTPGRIVVGLINSAGIRGDGPLILFSLQVLEKGSTAVPLVLENVAAYDASTLSRLTLSTMNGSFMLKDSSFTPPTLLFAPSAK